MKRMYVLLIMVVLVIGFTGNVHSESETTDGNKFLERCNNAISYLDGSKKDVSYVDAMFCLGYMEGMNTMNMFYQAMIGNNAFYCLPEAGMTNGQSARIIVKYLKEHPELLHEPAIALATRAFREAFPCKKQEQKK